MAQKETTRITGSGMALRAMRTVYDYDLAELSQKSGKTVSQLSEIENNHKSVTRNTAQTLDTAFGFEPGVMFSYLSMSASRLTWQSTLELALSFYKENQRRLAPKPAKQAYRRRK